MLGDRELHAVTVSMNVNKVKAGLRCGLTGTDGNLEKKNYRSELRLHLEIAKTETRIPCAFVELGRLFYIGKQG